MSTKQIKVAYFPSVTTKEKVIGSNGRVLDNYCIKLETTEELTTGNYILDGTFINTEDMSDILEEECILKVLMDYGDEVFRISKVNAGTRYIDIVARQITIADSLSLWLEDVRPTNMNGNVACNYMLSQATGKKEIELISNIGISNTAYYKQMSLYKALHDSDQSFQNRWGGEILRRAYIERINDKVGQDRGFTIREGKNLTGFESNSNIDSLVTRARGQGYNGIQGNYIDSPCLNNYNNTYTKVIKYDDVKVKGENDLEGYETLELAQAELDRRIQEEFSKNDIDKIKASYNINFVQLEKTEEYKNYVHIERVYLGDTVRVYIHKMNIDIKVRAITKKYDILTQKTKEVKLSNFVEKKSITIDQIKDKLDDLENNTGGILDEAKDYATQLINAGLKNSHVIVRQNEIIVGDTADINTMIKVWRWTNGGLGFSSDGYYGTFGTAITSDGKIIADFIKAGILNADLIKAGTLMSKNGNVWIDMDSGEFNFNNVFKFDGNEMIFNFPYATTDEVDNKVGAVEDIANNAKEGLDNIKNNGVDKVANTLVTINHQGIKVGRENSEFESVQNEKGNYMYAYGNEIARYDKDGLRAGYGVLEKAQIGHLRFETVHVGNEVHQAIHFIDNLDIGGIPTEPTTMSLNDNYDGWEI